MQNAFYVCFDATGFLKTCYGLCFARANLHAIPMYRYNEMTGITDFLCGEQGKKHNQYRFKREYFDGMI